MTQCIAAHRAAILMTVLPLIASCESGDTQLAEFARQAAQQQAQQQERMAHQSEAIVKQSQEVTAAARELVQQDAVARRDLIEAQDKLQKQSHLERVSLDNQRQQLDAERKAAASAAVRDPIVARAIVSGGLILAALAPLLVTLYALKRLPEQRPMDDLLGETLIQSVVNGENVLGFHKADALRVTCPPQETADG
jgi:hypothetical protein